MIYFIWIHNEQEECWMHTSIVLILFPIKCSSSIAGNEFLSTSTYHIKEQYLASKQGLYTKQKQKKKINGHNKITETRKTLK